MLLKLHKTSHTPVIAATNVGTTWYRVTLRQFEDFFETREENIFVRYVATLKLFECLNISQMFGSAIYDDELFICVTDGQPISVEGDDNVDPETAFESYTPDDLQAYIVDAKDEILIKYLSYREMLPDLLEDEQSAAAIDALESEDYTVKDVIDDYNEIW